MSPNVADNKVPRTRMDEVKFTKVWAAVYKNDGSTADVAREMGCTQSGASTKAKQLRELGLDLPVLKRASSKNRDIKSLQDILKAELEKK